MTPFPLKIVTPDGLIFDGQAEQLIVRTTQGDVAILARHIDYVASLGMGRATVIVDGKRRNAACMGGVLRVIGGEVSLVPTTFEWSEEIDENRAQRALAKAKKMLEAPEASDTDIALAEAKLRRALVRTSVASYK